MKVTVLLHRLILIVSFCFSTQIAAKDIILWHSMDGALGEIFNGFVEKFNQREDIVKNNVKIVPQFKGTYEQTLNAGLKVLNTEQAPHILQVFEMGNLVMQAHPEAYIPLDSLTDKPNPKLAATHFLPAIKDFYKSRKGEASMPSLPFSASSVILFYNKTAFKKAGLDPEKPPKTWEEFEKIAKTLKASKEVGAKTILASGWLSGHHIDQVGAWHNQPVATKGNGVDGDKAVLNVNTPFFQFHLSKLANWFKEGIFSLETGPKAETAFSKEEVLLLTQGANRLPVIEKQLENRFEIGVSAIPYWQSKIAAPQNTVAGGGSFWALKGHQPEDYKIIDSFFEYLIDPNTQAQWHQKTCYMPVVKGAEAITEQQKYYGASLRGQAAKVALDSFAKNTPKIYSRGILLPNFPRVREMMIQEMKEAIRGNKSTSEALNQIDMLGNKWMLDPA